MHKLDIYGNACKKLNRKRFFYFVCKFLLTFNRFKYEYDENVYVERRMKKIKSYILASKKIHHEQMIKGYFSGNTGR